MQSQDFVRGIVASMSLEEKVGQCVVVGMSGTTITNDLREAIVRYKAGGVRLSPFTRIFRYFSDDKAKGASAGGSAPDRERPSMQKLARQGQAVYVSPERFASTLNTLRDLAEGAGNRVPLHFVIDQEGDVSKDLSRGGVAQFPSNLGLAAAKDPDLVYRVSLAVAKQMRASGIDMIHSPVVDVNVNPLNPEIGVRSFGDDPVLVAELALAQVRGFKEGGVIAAAKHFPGRGDSATDAHHACPRLDVDRARLDAVELLPYKSLIASGELDAIMAAHCRYPALDGETIATVSRRVLTDLLRGELGFQGLVSTDSMTMGALIEEYGVGEACAMALVAGADTVLMKAENLWRGETFATIARYAREGRIPEAELDEKVSRIVSTKLRFGLFERMGRVDPSRASEPYRDPIIVETSREAARKAIMVAKDETGALPLDKARRTLLVNQLVTIKSPNDEYDHPALFQELLEEDWPELVTFEIAFGFDEAEEERLMAFVAAGGFETIICTNWYDRSEKPHRHARRLIDAGYPVVLIANTPYLIGGSGGLVPGAKTVVLDLNCTPEGLRAARDLLSGRMRGEATWPLVDFDPLGLRRAGEK